MISKPKQLVATRMSQKVLQEEVVIKFTQANLGVSRTL